jgi:hypothetical protein
MSVTRLTPSSSAKFLFIVLCFTHGVIDIFLGANYIDKLEAQVSTVIVKTDLNKIKLPWRCKQQVSVA